MKYRAILLSVAIFGSLLGQAAGQTSFGRSSSSGRISGLSDQFSPSAPIIDNAARPAVGSDHPSVPVPVDNSIDEDSYIIGGGDVFFVSFVSIPSMRFIAAVDRNGNLYIPELGLIKIGNVSLKEAKGKIIEYLTALNTRNEEFYVSLIKLKDATVSFTGNIGNPGSYEFSGSTRLLDALRTVNGGELPSSSEADLRRIVRTSGDSIAEYDLMAYLHNGDYAQNPYLYPGDRIRINPVTSRVTVSGPVKSPPSGEYPLKDGETLREFLSMFTLDEMADTDGIIIFRSAENDKITPENLDYVLSNLDAITIPVKRNLTGVNMVSISGEIASPGFYPITRNITTAKQLIEMSGGMKETASADQAVVVRQVKNLPERLNAGMPQLSMVRPERSASISMAHASLDYTVIRLVLYNADKIILEPGDFIFVPKKDSFVYISGSVRNPGAYPFRQGRDARYYVTQAGGFSRNADKSNMQVLMNYGDHVQSVELNCVEPGSVIMVPSSIQHKTLTQVILPVLTTVATIVTAVMAVYAQSR